jgi:hypothetical protein
MTLQLGLAYAAFWLTLLQALLVRAQIVMRACHRCGYSYERRRLGQPVCSCS